MELEEKSTLTQSYLRVLLHQFFMHLLYYIVVLKYIRTIANIPNLPQHVHAYRDATTRMVTTVPIVVVSASPRREGYS